jgi:hypothetical protein
MRWESLTAANRVRDPDFLKLSRQLTKDGSDPCPEFLSSSLTFLVATPGLFIGSFSFQINQITTARQRFELIQSTSSRLVIRVSSLRSWIDSV